MKDNGRRWYNLVTHRWELLYKESKPTTEDDIRRDLRALAGKPVLFNDDPRTRVKLGG